VLLLCLDCYADCLCMQRHAPVRILFSTFSRPDASRFRHHSTAIVALHTTGRSRAFLCHLPLLGFFVSHAWKQNTSVTSRSHESLKACLDLTSLRALRPFLERRLALGRRLGIAISSR
jgi:hypothetical protein